MRYNPYKFEVGDFVKICLPSRRPKYGYVISRKCDILDRYPVYGIAESRSGGITLNWKDSFLRSCSDMEEVMYGE